MHARQWGKYLTDIFPHSARSLQLVEKYPSRSAAVSPVRGFRINYLNALLRAKSVETKDPEERKNDRKISPLFVCHSERERIAKSTEQPLSPLASQSLYLFSRTCAYPARSKYDLRTVYVKMHSLFYFCASLCLFGFEAKHPLLFSFAFFAPGIRFTPICEYAIIKFN